MAGPLSYALTLNTAAFTAPLRGAQGVMRGFGSAASGVTGILGRLINPVTAIAGGIGVMGTAIGAFKVAADMESTVVSFGTLLGSAEKAEAMLKDIKATAETTPESFNSLTGAARSLLSVVSEDEMITNLRMIGDLASASQKPIGELASMYAKIKGGDVVQGEDLNQIGDALGGQALNEFAKVLGVDSVKAVRKMASEGLISGAVMEQVFINLTKQGGMAFGAMEAQSKTNTGLMSTLKDSLADVLLTIGMPMGDALKPILVSAIAMVKRIGLGLAGIVEIAKGAVAQGKLGELMGLVMKIGLKEAANYAVSSIVFIGEVLVRTLSFAFKQVVTLFTGGFNEAIGNISMGLLKVFAGLGKVILSKLGEPFRTSVAYFQAALGKAWNWFLSTVSSTWLGKTLGIDVDEKSFDELLAASKKAMQAGTLRANGEKDIAGGIAQMQKGVGQAMDKSLANLKEAFDGIELEKITVVNADKDKKTLGELAEKLSPEGYEKLMNAMLGSSEKAATATEKTGEVIRKAEGIEEAIKNANAKKEPKQKARKDKDLTENLKKKFRGVRSMAGSLVNRFRQNASDRKGSFADYVSKSAMNTNTVRRYAERKSISFEEAIAQLGAAAKKTRQKDAAKKADAAKKKQAANQESMLDVVKQIESHFSKIATT